MVNKQKQMVYKHEVISRKFSFLPEETPFTGFSNQSPRTRFLRNRPISLC